MITITTKVYGASTGNLIETLQVPERVYRPSGFSWAHIREMAHDACRIANIRPRNARVELTYDGDTYVVTGNVVSRKSAV